MRSLSVLPDPRASTAAMPALPLPEFTDRRHPPSGYQAADAGMVPRHATAGPGQETAIQYRAGPAARDFDQCSWGGRAKAEAGDDRTRPPLQAGRRRAADRDR